MRALDTPLTMAVLGLLRERPRHPYEMQVLLRERHVGAVVKLHGGSLYDAVGRLAAAGLVEPVEVNREGGRPERTVYGLTRAGAERLDALVRRYVGTVVPEFPVFAAGLAHVLHLPAREASTLLAARADHLEAEHDTTRQRLRSLRDEGLPRVVLLEVEYAQTVRRTEIDWLRRVVADISSGDLPWLDATDDGESGR